MSAIGGGHWADRGRITEADGKAPQVVACQQSCDFAAILYARRQFQQIEGIEIWRGMELVYARYPAISEHPERFTKDPL
jgi:hypothetical protein